MPYSIAPESRDELTFVNFRNKLTHTTGARAMRNWLKILCLGLAAGPMMAVAIEEPSFELLDTVEEVELRQYAPTIQARTPMQVDDSSSSGFKRLAGYIFGGNAQEQSIAMTAPVEQSMAAADAYMAFTMPSEHAMAELPAPNDSNVSLHEVPARTVAAISFSGWATGGKVEKMTRELMRTLEANGIETVGPPSLNQYNPPWTPPWMRRNEVVVEIAPRD